MTDGPWDIWGSLLNGIIGSVVGAAIAVLVLVVSLKKQQEALAEQLTAQQDALASQLQATQSENAKNRVNAVAADLIEVIAQLPMARVADLATLIRVRDKGFVSLYRLQLDLTDDELESFAEALSGWLKHLNFTDFDKFLVSGEVAGTAGTRALNGQAGWVCARIPRWIRASESERLKLSAEISASLKVAQKGPQTWLDMYPSIY